jgi:beta-galactosidase
LFRRRFNVPADWRNSGSRVFIVFEGVDSSLSVWLNGHFLGFSKDSCLPAEFDITDLLDRNDETYILACMVTRWSDASYLEDQDKWWLSGIYREVYIIKKPKVAFVQDYEIATKINWTSNQDSQNDSTFDVAESCDVSVNVSLEIDKILLGTGNLLVSCSLWPKGCRMDTAQAVSEINKIVDENDFNKLFPLKIEADKKFDSDESEILSTDTGYSGACVCVCLKVMNPALWNAEEPHLYTLVIALHHSSGGNYQELDVEATTIGIREVRIGGDQNTLQVNRRTIIIAGVNRNEFDCKQGRAVSVKTMVQDAKFLKEFNFNAVRMSHYPPHHMFLEICDDAGLYVVDETNIETHGFQVMGNPVGYLSHLNEWRGAMISRLSRMYERDKNYTCIIGWSLGNESGVGPNHDAMATWIRTRDLSGRFVQYEAGGSRTNLTDIICPMYKKPLWCIEKALVDLKKRPVILCEYAHAMGNSSGGLHHYWSLFHNPQLPYIQGGFIWDLVDQGLTLDQDSLKFKYGGDFGDYPNSRQFCINGIVGPDRMPHPIAYEAKALQSTVKFELVLMAPDNDLNLVVHNRNIFSNLDHIEILICIACDFIPNDDNSVKLAVPLTQQQSVVAGGKATIDVKSFIDRLVQNMLQQPVSALWKQRDRHLTDVWLDVDAVYRKSMKYVERGRSIYHTTLRCHQLASLFWDSLSLQKSFVPRSSSRAEILKLEVMDKNEAVIRLGWSNGNQITIGKACGRLLSWTFGNSRINILESPMDLCFWRAPTDNDVGGQHISYCSVWKAYGLHALKRKDDAVIDINDDADNGDISIRCHWFIQSDSTDCVYVAKIKCGINYTLSPSGSIAISFFADLPSYLPCVPRFGIQCSFASLLDTVRWLGQGPHEAYDDRQSSIWTALFSASVNDMHTPYVVPQENGRRANPK